MHKSYLKKATNVVGSWFLHIICIVIVSHEQNLHFINYMRPDHFLDLSFHSMCYNRSRNVRSFDGQTRSNTYGR